MPMHFSIGDISKALSKVQDPDLRKDLVSLGMIKDIVAEAHKVSFTLVLTTPACPLREKIKQDCMDAVRKVVGDNVEIAIKMDASVTSTRDENTLLRGVKNVIAIASGKGGVGKSTVATNMAVSLAQGGAQVGLLDADIYGPSMPVMFNCEHEQPEVKTVDKKKLIMPIERYGVKLVSIGFFAPAESAVIWRGPMASATLKQFIRDVSWGDLDYLFIDLPPGTGDIHLTLVQSIPLTGAVIVTTPQKVALADATKSLCMFRQPRIDVPVLGVVENMAYFTPEELPDNQYFLFGKGGGERLAKKYDVPLLAQIPLVQQVRESGDSGLPAVLKQGVVTRLFTKLAESLAQQVAICNAQPKKPEQAQTTKV